MAPKVGETDSIRVVLPNGNRTNQAPIMRTGYIVPVGQKPDSLTHNILNSEDAAQRFLDHIKKQNEKKQKIQQVIPFIRTLTPEEIERKQKLEKLFKSGGFEKLLKR